MSSLLDVANLEIRSDEGTSARQQTPPSQNAILTRQRARLLNGIHTEVLLQSYADRILVVITQLGRIGSLLQVNPPPAGLPPPLSTPHLSSNDALPPLPKPDPSMTVISVFGAAPSAQQARLHELYALEVATIVFDAAQRAGERETRPVLLGIALKLPPPVQSDSERDEDGFEISQVERESFTQSMQMVQQCMLQGS